MKRGLIAVLFFIYDISPAQSHKFFIQEGNSKYKEKKYEEALENYQRAFLMNKSFASRFNSGNALYRMDKDSASFAILKDALLYARNKKDSSAAFYNAGNSLLKAKKYAEAVEMYKRALILNPGDTDAMYNLSYALMKIPPPSPQTQQENNKNNQQQKQQQNQQKPGQKDEKERKSQEEQKSASQKNREMEAIFHALENKERNLYDRVLNQPERARRFKPEKDW